MVSTYSQIIMEHFTAACFTNVGCDTQNTDDLSYGLSVVLNTPLPNSEWDLDEGSQTRTFCYAPSGAFYCGHLVSDTV
jgi:hypothetical protein